MSEIRTIALVGNPNVGKSTVFNRLTGMRQHTGNWPGKTVEVARGRFEWAGAPYEMIDLPGAYSLAPRSREEEVTRDYILSNAYDAVCVVCDATCLVRSLPLALQAMEITPRVVLCVNLIDEAKKRGIDVDGAALETALGVRVACVSARGGEGVGELMEKLSRACEAAERHTWPVIYAPEVERAAQAAASAMAGGNLRWRSLRAVEEDENLEKSIVASLFMVAETVCEKAVKTRGNALGERYLAIDRMLTGRKVGIPAMLLLMALVFYLTISGSNVISGVLISGFARAERWLAASMAPAPWWLKGALADGLFKVTAWVVAVMLPPMAIFFPLFTLLEDLGYLPRVAFNLDGCFRCCKSSGKQALTMLMGFGCNACGVTGCRIIDSPRERLVAILTNALVPCNGRFPFLILLLTLYASAAGLGALAPAVGLTALVALGVFVTLAASRLLSDTLLKGVPSSFALELPPYRRPQVARVVTRSLLDRTLFVLGRAVSVAAPAGIVLWALGNVRPGGANLMGELTRFLDPAGRALGMDGVMLLSFVLGFPANELVLPIALMLYQSSSVLADVGAATGIAQVLAGNGWTGMTAVCAMLFTLFHWPCSTTLLTVRRETGSIKWTLVAFLLPTAIGAALCAVVSGIWRCFL